MQPPRSARITVRVISAAANGPDDNRALRTNDRSGDFPVSQISSMSDAERIVAMQIRLGYELVYDCPQPTPMLLMLNIHHTRVSDILVPDRLVTDPPLAIGGYRDGFCKWWNRVVAPTGR